MTLRIAPLAGPAAMLVAFLFGACARPVPPPRTSAPVTDSVVVPDTPVVAAPGEKTSPPVQAIEPVIDPPRPQLNEVIEAADDEAVCRVAQRIDDRWYPAHDSCRFAPTGLPGARVVMLSHSQEQIEFLVQRIDARYVRFLFALPMTTESSQYWSTLWHERVASKSVAQREFTVLTFDENISLRDCPIYEDCHDVFEEHIEHCVICERDESGALTCPMDFVVRQTKTHTRYEDAHDERTPHEIVSHEEHRFETTIADDGTIELAPTTRKRMRPNDLCNLPPSAEVDWRRGVRISLGEPEDATP